MQIYENIRTFAKLMDGSIHILGILNLTPDSFYAGSRCKAADAPVRIRQLLEEGADAVDLGACSTRPGAALPSLEEEWSRLEPVLNEIGRDSLQGTCPPPDEGRGRGPLATSSQGGRRRQWEGPEGAQRPEFPWREFLPISIDTFRSEIVRRAYEIIGPFMVNDISGGMWDSRMLPLVGRLGLPYVAMHLKGTPETMHREWAYEQDVVADVIAFFRDFAAKARENGIRDWLADPGFGFSKSLEQNWELLRRLEEVVQAVPQPMLVGLSRKSMVYKALGISPEEAMPATQAVQWTALQKGARWLRVHDVAAACQTARLYSTMYTSSPGAAK